MPPRSLAIMNAHASVDKCGTPRPYCDQTLDRGTGMKWPCHVIAGIVVGLAVTGPAAAGQAATADAIRGGWVADVDGTRHIFILKVQDATVTGIYCAVDCGDP